MNKKTKNLLLIGGAIAATGTAIYLIAKKREEEADLTQKRNYEEDMAGPTAFPSGPSNIVGCTNPEATNYNPSANADDGSCEFPAPSPVVYGCMDADADNFNPNATHQDASCEYAEGCTDTNARNYDAGAFLDDGSCLYDVSPATNVVYGCTDELAENYDPNATNSNNTTCVYLEGCKLPDATNYDPLAVIDDGSCVFQSVGIEDATYQLGCMDGAASNYDPQATLDNGTCQYQGGCMIVGDPNYDPNAIYDNGTCAGSPAVISNANYVFGCMDEAASNYNPSATLDNGECQYVGGCMIVGDANYNPNAIYENGTCAGVPSAITSSAVYVEGCMDEAASNYDASATLDDGSCLYVGGCMIQNDPAYNPNALYDNGTCVGQAVSISDAQYILGCMDAAASNYDATATLDNGTCTYRGGCMIVSDANYDPEAIYDNGTCAGSPSGITASTQYVLGCKSPLAENYDPLATLDNGSCTFKGGCLIEDDANYDPDAVFDNGSCSGIPSPSLPSGIPYIEGCRNPLAVNFDASATLDNGQCEFVGGCMIENDYNFKADAVFDDGSCVGTPVAIEDLTTAEYISGCTNPLATNYNSSATLDDGSCDFVGGCMIQNDPNYKDDAVFDDGSCVGIAVALENEQYVLGCKDETAINFNPNATLDDGSCGFIGGCMIQGDAAYNPMAQYDDGSCQGITTAIQSYEYTLGCTSPLAWNKDDTATLDDGSCEFIEGCTIEGDPNYNPEAVVDDGSCAGEPLYDLEEFGSDEYILGCTNPLAANHNPAATLNDGSCNFKGGCMIPSDPNFDIEAVYDDGGCVGTPFQDLSDFAEEEYIEGCTNPNAANHNPSATLNDGSCTFVVGCTIEGDANYNPMAVADDGSCSGISVQLEDAEYIQGCTNPLATNHNPAATLNDGSCLFKGGCMIVGDPNYDSTAVVDNGSCVGIPSAPEPSIQYTPACLDPLASNTISPLLVEELEALGQTPINDPDLCNYKSGCTIVGNDNYDPEAVVDDGSCYFEVGPPIDFAEESVTYYDACTDPNSLTYVGDDILALYEANNIVVVSDPTQCQYQSGCMNPNGLNYDATAVRDTGLCVFETSPSNTPITTNDAITILTNVCAIQVTSDLNLELNAMGNLSLGAINMLSEQITGNTCLDLDAETGEGFSNVAYLPTCGLEQASNYNPSVGLTLNGTKYVQDNSTCVFNAGCTSVDALNFEASAVSDDESCVFASGGGAQVVDAETAQRIYSNNCPFATSAPAIANAISQQGAWTLSELNALVFDIQGAQCFEIPQLYDLTDFDVNVEFEYVGGCMNQQADNYNPNASYDDGSCTFNDLFEGIEAETGCKDVNANNFDPNATISGQCTFDEVVYDLEPVAPTAEYVGGCLNQQADNYNPDADYDDESCTFFNLFANIEEETGCKDVNANNYDPNATISGQCTFDEVEYDLEPDTPAPEYFGGCLNPQADNYNPNADYDDESCTFNNVFADIEAATGCKDENANNFDPNAVYSGQCTFDAVDYQLPDGGETISQYVGGCIDPEADNFDATADYDDGSCSFALQFGCTIEGAQNYDSNAKYDDGQCVFIPTGFTSEQITYGCTYEQATNFNPQADADDGSCTFTSESCALPSDMTQSDLSAQPDPNR
jgi:hypothetical protein